MHRPGTHKIRACTSLSYRGDDNFEKSNRIRQRTSGGPAAERLCHQLLLGEETVEQCYQVTGQHSHMIKANCQDIPTLERLINRLQKMGQTNTQIVLSTVRGPGIRPVYL